MWGHASSGRVVNLGSKRVGPASSPRNQHRLHNYLDRDLQKFLRPLNLSRQILLSSSYSVRDNFIEPSSRCYLCCSFVLTFCFAVIYTIALMFFDDIKYFQSLLHIIFFINHVFYIIGSVFNAIINAVQSDAQVRLITNIQKLKSSFKFVEISCTGFVIGNWVYVLSISIFYVIVIIIHICLGNLSSTVLMCYKVLLLADLNILYMIRIIKLLTHSITLSILELIRASEIDNGNRDRINEERTQTEHWSRMVNCCLDTMDCLHVYKKLYEAPCFFYMCVIFLYSLTNVQVLIVNSKNNLLILTITLLWTVKQTILLFLLSFESERLCVTLKNTQITFVTKIKDAECSDKHKVYTSLYRASMEACRALKTGGIIAVDASLPLTLVSLVATYAVVLLQIAFL